MKDYPSPKPDDEVFTKMWNTFLPDIIARANFKEGHLVQLEVLCELFSEQNYLKGILEVTGMTYIAENANGTTQRKIAPEVTQLNKIREQIGKFSKSLGIAIYKDERITGDMADDDDWD